MYNYNEVDRSVVHHRVEEFRDQVRRRLSGELTEDEFKPCRLMNGLYLQLHGYMLRIAIPYGTLSSKQLRMLAQIARDFDRGYGHFTTRQNLQLNWLKLDEVPNLLGKLAEVEMHAIQTSGNCIRNITSDPYAGATIDEVEDPRITAEVVRQWSTLHPEFSFLPRKFKIAVTASEVDRAAIAVHDIGLRIRRLADGSIRYEVWVGGGLGRTPVLAEKIHDSLSRQELLPYLDAILRVYNRYGNRDNKYKARIKILVRDLGADAFRQQVEKEWQLVRAEEPELFWSNEKWSKISAYFASPPPAPARTTPLHPDESQPAFRRWLKHNTRPHRDPNRRIALISLKPPGGIPGDATSEQMELVANLAQKYSEDELRVTHQQNLVLAHVEEAQLFNVWQKLDAAGLGTSNHGLLSDIIACPGLDYCNLANARSIPIAQSLSERFSDREDDIGELSIKISGCINSCGHHHVGNIGILGTDKRGEEAYQITVGGNAGYSASLAKVIGPAVTPEQVPVVIEKLIDTYLSQRKPDEDFLHTMERLGKDILKESFREATNA
ncbi:MAG: nitrite/sulfite reductase [Myxococcales bacterium]|nr:nitrite/sulfite reductase [Myxococcales bacterium]